MTLMAISKCWLSLEDCGLTKDINETLVERLEKCQQITDEELEDSHCDFSFAFGIKYLQLD